MTTTCPSCESAGFAVQVTVSDRWSAQVAAASPSESASVSVAGPAAVQVKLVDAAAALAKVPEVAVHAYESGDGPASVSWPLAARAIELPTITSAGLADRLSICGQMLIVPLTDTLPVVGASWQVRCRVTMVVWAAVTLNVAEPRQLMPPLVVVPFSEMV